MKPMRTQGRAYLARQRMLARQAHLGLVVDGQHHLRAPGILQRLRAGTSSSPIASMHGPQDQCALPRGAVSLSQAAIVWPLQGPQEHKQCSVCVPRAPRVAPSATLHAGPKPGAGEDEVREVATAHLNLVYNHRLVCEVHDGLWDCERQGPEPRAETAHQYQGFHGAWLCCARGASCSGYYCLRTKCMRKLEGVRF